MGRGFAPVFEGPSRQTILKLSAVFALIYFFSPNGISSLPGLTVSFLLKDALKMTAEQAAYFGAITLVGWAVKPLWGVISDAFPLFGLRRKSYLLVTTVGAALIWSILGFLNDYSVAHLLVLFSLSSILYSFMDVLCDALMVETGRPHNLTGRFQSVQWTAVYVASIITGLAGGYVAAHWEPQEVFILNAAFPLVILVAVLLFLRETRQEGGHDEVRARLAVVKKKFAEKQTWLLAFFIFFVAFSPSFGAPFFYYSVDTLKFTPIFLGVAASIAAATSALGAILFGKFSARFATRRILKISLIFFTFATLFDLVYFLPAVTERLQFARYLYGATAAINGVMGAIVFLTILNSAALAAPKGAEGTAFATLTAFWNVGLIGSSALGGYLFGQIGLQPLIIISAVFTLAALLFLPRLSFADERGFASVSA
ncbi:MAG: MFS transporter [Patescibacteria group bacterium]